MPKIDLHCHLDGSLSRHCIEELLGRKVELRELQVEPNCTSLAEYLEKFDLPLSRLQDENGLKNAGYDFIRGVAAEQIDYVEVRFAPLLSCTEGLNSTKVIEAVLEGLNRGKEAFGVDYGVIVCAMRHEQEEANRKMLYAAREFLGAGVCAADLAGNEAAFPMSMFMDLFGEARRLEMPFTIHAGECGNAQNIVDAVECGASRIGHGIAMRGRADVMQLCREKHVGIEMCPISNLQTKAVQSMAEYPMREFVDNGICVTINTDNRMVSGTTIDKEIAFVKANYGINDDEITQMMKNAVEVSFASDDIKHRLWNLF